MDPGRLDVLEGTYYKMQEILLHIREELGALLDITTGFLEERSHNRALVETDQMRLQSDMKTVQLALREAQETVSLTRDRIVTWTDGLADLRVDTTTLQDEAKVVSTPRKSRRRRRRV